MGDGGSQAVQPGVNGTSARPLSAAPSIAPQGQGTSGGGVPSGGTGTPPSFYSPINVTNWAQALTLMGVTVIDSNKDGKVDNLDAEAIFKEKGVDISDGIDYTEAKKLNPNLKESAFNVLSVGGHGTGGDGKIEFKDLVTYNNDVVNRLASASGGREAVIAKYLAANTFSMMDPDKAAAKISEQKKTVPNLYAADGRIKVNVFLEKCINPALRGTAVAVLANITRQPVDDNLYLNADQFKTFLLAMNFLGQIDKPEDVLVSASGIPKLGEKDDLLSWLTNSAVSGGIPAEPKPAAKAGEESKAGGPGITQEEAQKANDLDQNGTLEDQINYLADLNKKYPNNTQVASMLAKKYEDRDQEDDRQNALKLRIQVYEKVPNAENKGKVLVCAVKWQEKAGGNELTAEQKELAVKTRAILDKIVTSESGDKKKAIEELSAQYGLLIAGPLPGEADYKKVISDTGSTILQIKDATNAYADKLSAEIDKEKANPSADKARLARMYVKLAEIRLSQWRAEEAQSNMAEALKLAGSLPEEKKNAILKSAEFMIYRLVHLSKQSKEINNERAAKIFESDARRLFEEYKKVTGKDKVTIKLSDKKSEDIRLSDLKSTAQRKGGTQEDLDLIQVHITMLAKAAKASGDKDNADYKSPEERREMGLSVTFALDKYKDNKDFYSKLTTWANDVARDMKADEPTNPKGKFTDYQKAVDFIISISQ